MSFMSAMLVFQDVQKRAQEEIDRVLGDERLPTFSDRKSLPYIEAIIRELLRMYPVIPLGTLSESIVLYKPISCQRLYHHQGIRPDN